MHANLEDSLFIELENFPDERDPRLTIMNESAHTAKNSGTGSPRPLNETRIRHPALEENQPSPPPRMSRFAMEIPST
jgi:hypothetical protein